MLYVSECYATKFPGYAIRRLLTFNGLAMGWYSLLVQAGNQSRKLCY